MPDPLSKDWKYKDSNEIEVPLNIGPSVIIDIFSIVSRKKSRN